MAQEPDSRLDLIDIGPHLLGWGDRSQPTPWQQSRPADVAVFASPTYKGAYTGLLKLFLDQVPTDGFNGVIAFPVMLGAALGHAMAPDLLLKPVLVELGATCPARGLYLLETDYRSEAIVDPWAARRAGRSCPAPTIRITEQSQTRTTGRLRDAVEGKHRAAVPRRPRHRHGRHDAPVLAAVRLQLGADAPMATRSACACWART